jgi:glycosyltransferase involved in cell wall biosynthesis
MDGRGPELTAVILTLNEETHITDCIRSLEWADRVLVFDSFSTDRTVALAKEAGAAVLQHKFANYAQQRNAALDAIQTDWVFFVDADERGTPELGAEILRVIGRSEAAARPERGWEVPRHNYIFGRLTKGRGLVPRLSAAAVPARQGAV